MDVNKEIVAMPVEFLGMAMTPEQEQIISDECFDMAEPDCQSTVIASAIDAGVSPEQIARCTLVAAMRWNGDRATVLCNDATILLIVPGVGRYRAANIGPISRAD